MPNPHFRIEVYSRAGGRSVVAAAAYRSGEVLTASPSVVGMAAYRAGEYLGDKETGETFDYTRKEGVEWSHIFTPEKAPNWAGDREQLWNRAELAEIRKDARLARGIEASLARGLELEQWQEMTGELADHFTRYGLIVDASIHNVRARDGGMNPHIHLLIADRPVDENGFKASKTNVRFLNSDLALQGWREAWEDITNRHLEAAGLEERVSLKSYKARGLDIEPTQPLGPKASEQEKRGIKTPQGDKNRRIMADRELAAEMRRLQEEEGTPAANDNVREARSEQDYADAAITADLERDAMLREIERDAQERQARIDRELDRALSRAGDQLRRREERNLIWSDFATELSGASDAARGALHRFRLREGTELSDTLEDTRTEAQRQAQLAAAITSISEKQQRIIGTIRANPGNIEYAPATEQETADYDNQDAPIGGTGSDEQRQAALAAAMGSLSEEQQAFLQAMRVQSGVVERDPDLSDSSPGTPITPQEEQEGEVERYQGRTTDATDEPRAPQLPPEVERRAPASAAALSAEARQQLSSAARSLEESEPVQSTRDGNAELQQTTASVEQQTSAEQGREVAAARLVERYADARRVERAQEQEQERDRSRGFER